jgi:transposase-like protein
MSKRRSFTPEFKARVVLEVLTGAKSAAQVCREHQLKDTVLSRWKREFVERSPKVFEGGKEREREDERVAELERMVGRLTMELEIAKKASLLLTARRDGSGR